MARGEKALAEHRYNHARPDFQAILQDEPANRTAQVALVRIHIAQQDPAAALELLDELAKSRTQPRDAGLLRGEADLMAGRFDDALAAVANDMTAEAWRIRAIATPGATSWSQWPRRLRAVGAQLALERACLRTLRIFAWNRAILQPQLGWRSRQFAPIRPT